jgi:hypothetical protein
MKTAVEWLQQEVILQTNLPLNLENVLVFNKLFEQAKEMEKEQIMDAFNQGYREAELNLNEIVNKGDISKFYDAQNYYNETFKQQDNDKG